jgi:hypothetical protein
MHNQVKPSMMYDLVAYLLLIIYFNDGVHM